VPPGARLIVADRAHEDAALSDLGLAWLRCVALDHSTPLRGIAVLDAAAAARIGERNVAVYRPATEYVKK
jgi:hypothetical protein